MVEPFDIPVGRVAVVADPFGNTLVLLDLSRGRYVTDDAGTVTGVASGPAAPGGSAAALAASSRRPGHMTDLRGRPAASAEKHRQLA